MVKKNEIRKAKKKRNSDLQPSLLFSVASVYDGHSSYPQSSQYWLIFDNSTISLILICI